MRHMNDYARAAGCTLPDPLVLFPTRSDRLTAEAAESAEKLRNFVGERRLIPWLAEMRNHKATDEIKKTVLCFGVLGGLGGSLKS